MTIREILLLGNPKLYEVCEPVTQDEVPELVPVVSDLRDTLLAFRRRWNAGRAIAAPQIGVPKRLVYMEIDAPTPMFNPVLTNLSAERFELWDDCMSFPDLFVYVSRHARCDITYRDLDWVEHTLSLEGDLAELLQHECDHLDGILAVSRALDGRSLALRSEHTRRS
jgi:peptide deformylase